MADRHFIHSTRDVTATLLYALDSGLHVMLDTPQAEPDARMVTRADVNHLESGSFHLFRPEWVYGPFQTMVIPSGYNQGKYFVQPRVNFIAVSVYFQGEQIDHGHKRYGNCCVSCHQDWLEMPAQISHPAPPDVRQWWKRITEYLSSGVVIKAGVHRYHVSKNVQADPNATNFLAPFDFIPWGKELKEG